MTTTDLDAVLAANIRRLRKERGWNQQEFAVEVTRRGLRGRGRSPLMSSRPSAGRSLSPSCSPFPLSSDSRLPAVLYPRRKCSRRRGRDQRGDGPRLTEVVALVNYGEAALDEKRRALTAKVTDLRQATALAHVQLSDFEEKVDDLDNELFNVELEIKALDEEAERRSKTGQRNSSESREILDVGEAVASLEVLDRFVRRLAGGHSSGGGQDAEQVASEPPDGLKSTSESRPAGWLPVHSRLLHEAVSLPAATKAERACAVADLARRLRDAEADYLTARYVVWRYHSIAISNEPDLDEGTYTIAEAMAPLDLEYGLVQPPRDKFSDKAVREIVVVGDAVGE